MKIITSRKVFDLNNFESVTYNIELYSSRERALGMPRVGYEVNAIGNAPGLFGMNKRVTEHIATFLDEKDAANLVACIASAWGNNQDTFNVREWVEKIQAERKATTN